jgi:hypothetical protein
MVPTGSLNQFRRLRRNSGIDAGKRFWQWLNALQVPPADVTASCNPSAEPLPDPADSNAYSELASHFRARSCARDRSFGER